MSDGHGGCHGGCSHNHDEPELGIAYSLYAKIDLDRVECLNEAVEGSGKTVFKPWEDRLDTSKLIESDADEEVLINIPFTGNVKLKGIIIRGGEDDSHPSAVKLFKNRPNMSFDDVSVEADQEFQLHRDNDGTLEYPVKVVKFAGVNHLTLYFPKNFGDETTRIYYIGLKGDFSPALRDAILITNYELAANPADHKASLSDSVPRHVD